MNVRGALVESSKGREEGQSEQYSLAKILVIWGAAALPMAVLAWVIAQYVDAPVTALQMPAHMYISRLADPRFVGQ